MLCISLRRLLLPYRWTMLKIVEARDVPRRTDLPDIARNDEDRLLLSDWSRVVTRIHKNSVGQNFSSRLRFKLNLLKRNQTKVRGS